MSDEFDLMRTESQFQFFSWYGLHPRLNTPLACSVHETSSSSAPKTGPHLLASVINCSPHVTQSKFIMVIQYESQFCKCSSPFNSRHLSFGDKGNFMNKIVGDMFRTCHTEGMWVTLLSETLCL